MIINYFGHACFGLESQGFSLVIDPYKDVDGWGSVCLEANEVYCSHNHSDHNYCAGVKLVNGVSNPFEIIEINSFHDDVGGDKRGENIIRIFRAEGFSVAHFGDIGCKLNKEEIDLLKDVDVALVPIGGVYTIDGSGAKSLIETIGPKTVIPMHYRNGQFGLSKIDSLADFVKLFDDVHYVENRMEITKLPMGVAVMDVVLK